MNKCIDNKIADRPVEQIGINRNRKLRKVARKLYVPIRKRRIICNVNYQFWNVLTVTERAKPLLKGEEKFFIRVDGLGQLSSRKVIDHEDLDDSEQILFHQLRQWRKEVARQREIASYNVFTDETLIQIAKRKPRQPSQLLGISGIGEKRIAHYGESVCELINAWYQEQKHMPI